MNEKTKGFIPVMLTPFNADGVIDYDGLTRLTELYLEAGVAGMFANCLSSEMFELSADERLSVVKHIVDITAGKVPVVATATFGGPIAEQADYVKRMYDTGVEATIVITNMLAGENEADEVFEENVFQLLEQTDSIPVGFYECPEPFKRIVSAAQLGMFVDTGRVIYHKDTCLDLAMVKDKLDATKHVSDFGLYDAYMVHAVESLKAGSAGLSCIQGNYFPELVVWLCNNYDKEGAAEEVAQVQRFFVEHMDVMHNMYPTVAKYFLQRRNLPINTFTRKSVGVFNAEIRSQIDVLYDDYEQLNRCLDVRLVV